jgi:precorrin-6Y C5,15-methyltransferase (decarboxylating)
LLWDVGAGAGSVAIEWMLADPSMRASRSRRARARGAHPPQRRGFGVPALEIVEGRAPAAFDGLAQPDAVFVGGGRERCGSPRRRAGPRCVRAGASSSTR